MYMRACDLHNGFRRTPGVLQNSSVTILKFFLGLIKGPTLSFYTGSPVLLKETCVKTLLISTP